LDPTDLREAVNRILTSISDEPFVLMGTSLGGGLAVRFALEHPDRVSKLVLCSPAGAPMSERELKSLLARFEMKSIADGTDYVRRIFHRPPWYHHLLGREVYLLLKSPMVQRLVGQASPEDFLTAEELGSLIPPTLLIWGQSERLLPAECLDWFKANLPSHATIIEPEGYGHSPHLEQADDLARRVIGFAGN
jgi:pimeloyl-ACP methyl ester carboxylesterase